VLCVSVAEVNGFLYSVQYKWRNGENNRTLTLTLSLTITLTPTLFLTKANRKGIAPFALRHLHYAEYGIQKAEVNNSYLPIELRNLLQLRLITTLF